MKIPDEIKQKIEDIVDKFRKEYNFKYSVSYKGKFAYFDEKSFFDTKRRFRLEYTGDMNDWDFAIFKYSSESYDPSEFMFPGAGSIDGTVVGAMKAGMEAYSSR